MTQREDVYTLSFRRSRQGRTFWKNWVHIWWDDRFSEIDPSAACGWAYTTRDCRDLSGAADDTGLLDDVDDEATAAELIAAFRAQVTFDVADKRIDVDLDKLTLLEIDEAPEDR